MWFTQLTLTLVTALVAEGAPPATSNRAAYLDWSSFEANGVNLGGWLHQEQVIDPVWWDANGGAGLLDEWDWCANLGSQCGPRLEQRYASFITAADIDKMAAARINVLRIPTGYNAWVQVPGSPLYTGSQTRFLRTISDYAIRRHGIHIIVDIHSLPGGVNNLGLGGREGRHDWFNNQTALDYSYKAVDAALKFIQESDFPDKFTLQPLNEPVDNPAAFGFPDALTDAGAAWVLSYFRGVLARVQAANANIPIMLQGSFRPVSFWSPSFADTDNIVFDVHNYYFAGRPTTSANLPQFLCEDAQNAVDDRFPVFVGEWSIEASSNNTLANRPRNLNTGLKAWAQYTQGSSFWTWKFRGNVPVNGEGTQAEYWDYEEYVDAGFIDAGTGQECPTTT
uniref:glucan 1,3-beta-glucosidase n=1 Tax=Bionectria ochroleuca TaxID=29856 RepID=A0A8H7K243_BIOOC